MASSEPTATEPQKAHDLLVVLDATASMGSFIRALNLALPEIISLSALTGCFERIGVVAYRDYCGGRLTEFSGWCSPSGAVTGPDIVSQDDVLKMAGNIIPDRGGDWPEATKTGLALAYEHMREEATTIMLLYTDAPPHFPATKSENQKTEQRMLNIEANYGGTAHLFADWASAANTLKSSNKKAVVFSILSKSNISTYSPYLFLSTVTGGTLFMVNYLVAEVISTVTISLLLTWMGAGNSLVEDNNQFGQHLWYEDTKKLAEATSESSAATKTFITTGLSPSNSERAKINFPAEDTRYCDMPTVITARGPSIRNFAKRYVEDEDYKKFAVDQLWRIIETKVSAVAVNPIFGTLWRTVCSDRNNPARDELITLFGREVEKIFDVNEKVRMKAWLEESYNYAAEIQDTIAKVPEQERFPMVFLDPTEKFTTVSADQDDDGDDSRPLNEFTRAELLEIGRSCDYRILRRLGTVLTRLTYVDKAEDLPEHIMKASAEDVPQIPMALADAKYDRKFWKVLLHAVLPGTMLAVRPAALLAALALRMGILPLRDAADKELLAFRDKWNTLDIAETWNLGCLGLLLDADKDYEARVASGVTQRHWADASILTEGDRKLFKTLVDYKMLEINLKTTVEAKVGWKPEKTKSALGPVVVCRECKFPRSVTIMAAGGVCGLCRTAEEAPCHCAACSASEDHEERLKTNVATDHDEKTLGAWVECNRNECRAQYVVYNTDKLRVRAKCFYCRHLNDKNSNFGAAPLIECSKCLSQIIWPEEYRPTNFDLSSFECAACTSNVVTIISCDTSAEALSAENGRDWLLRNDDRAIHEPFNNRSVFYTASHCDLADLPEKVEVLPDTATAFTLSGKLVRNTSEVKEALAGWVRTRRAEAGTCDLCFKSVRKADLHRACGRKGCAQLICQGCSRGWYGLNARGQLVNVAALSCPFCRRRPAPRVLNSFGITALGDLRLAVEQAGSWIYAWCRKCDFAKPYIERVCAAGAPPELSNWACDECRQSDAMDSPAKACPGCGTMTEKVGGCDHITCPCGVHWCYACGKEPGEIGIYPHMEREHGGLGFGEGDEDEYEDDEYDDYGW